MMTNNCTLGLGAIGKIKNNGDKCMVICGDDLETPGPRDNENGGK